MRTISVSVVIPCYNAAKFLDETIKSVLEQTFQDFEIIAVDDRSTDKTLEVLAKYPVIVLRHSINQGQSAALNTGISAARGKYIALLDADDLWAPRKLEVMVEALEVSNAVGAYSAVTVVNEKLLPLYRHTPEHHVEKSVNELLLNNYILTCGFIGRADCFRQAGPYDTTLQSSDHDMMLRLRELGEFIYIPQSLAYYRQHAEQISLRRKQWEDGFKILRKAKKRYPYHSWLIRKRLAVIYYRLACYDAKLRNPLAIPYFALAAMLDPARVFKIATDKILGQPMFNWNSTDLSYANDLTRTSEMRSDAQALKKQANQR